MGSLIHVLIIPNNRITKNGFLLSLNTGTVNLTVIVNGELLSDEITTTEDLDRSKVVLRLVLYSAVPSVSLIILTAVLMFLLFRYIRKIKRITADKQKQVELIDIKDNEEK